MHKISDSIVYIGVNDHEIDLFEGQYTVPNGMAYNSYLLLDEKLAVMDTVDQTKTEQWLQNLDRALAGRTPDYLIVQHMEPDHSASLDAFVDRYPSAAVVGNAKTFAMIRQFFPALELQNTITVKDGESLSLGRRELTFVLAPMVHWPEVMMTYDSGEKTLFSADAFGKFGALDAEEDWACEARRYYFGIVGKYGAQVQAVLKKAAALEIVRICPLHGPVLEENLNDYLQLYDTWSSYRAESEGVCICYTSIYGHTKAAAELLRDTLEQWGVKVAFNDLARCDFAEAVEDAFRYDRLVLATTTYNMGLFPFMQAFIHHLTERNFQNRTVGLIENGTWAPVAIKGMKAALEGAKNLTFTQTQVTVRSSLNADSRAQILALAEELAGK
ncbi:MAG: FprA family A-type flavoprotein [Candidatus Howiella sp.]|jgi:flavorubredoxin